MSQSLRSRSSWSCPFRSTCCPSLLSRSRRRSCCNRNERFSYCCSFFRSNGFYPSIFLSLCSQMTSRWRRWSSMRSNIIPRCPGTDGVELAFPFTSPACCPGGDDVVVVFGFPSSSKPHQSINLWTFRIFSCHSWDTLFVSSFLSRIYFSGSSEMNSLSGSEDDKLKKLICS
jgi:hypothetical protein